MPNCKTEKPMAIQAIASGALAGVKALQGQKIAQAQTGQKTFSAPKTGIGKLIGSVSGRTQAFQIQESMKKESIANAEVQRASTPITGGISFGGEATKRTWLPFAVIAGLVLIFFNRKKSRRRR